ncbi:MAG TPA: hypothetical protein VGA63_13850 [Geopsychrobacteraceae bacterium]
MLPIMLPILLSALLLPTAARADRLSLLADLDYTILDNKSTNRQTGAVTKTDTERFSQLYTLDMDKTLTQVLTFNAGGTFDLNEADTETDGFKRTGRDRQIRPYLGLELNTPFYRSGVNYRKSELTNSGTGITKTRAYAEEYTANLSWRPSDLPKVSMEYVRALAYDDAETRDGVNDAFSFTSRYDYRQYNFDVTHTRNDNRDKLNDFETRSRNYSGGVSYAERFLDDRLGLNTGVKLDRSSTEFAGSGERLLRTVPIGAGFFLLSDPFPSDNTADEFTAVDAASRFSEINIGLGGGSGLLSFGLFFDAPVEVDVIRLPLVSDPNDPTVAGPGQVAAVAGLLDWTLFVSDDQLTWTEVPIASVAFDQFDNRFELRPARTLTENYFKIVTSPLGVAAPGKILLNDVQALTVLPENVRAKITSLNQYYNFGLNYQFSAATSLSYDTYYQQQDTEPFGGDSRSWSNGVSLRHRFNPTFLGTSRLLRSDTWRDGSKNLTSHSFSTSLNAQYLQTFNQTLTYSMNHTSERAGSSLSNALVLRSNLDVYDGFSLSLDQGYSRQEPVEGEDSSSVFVRGRSHIVPHRRVDLNLDYGVAWGSAGGQPDIRTETGRFTGFWLLLDTLSLSTEVNLRKTARDGESVTRVQRDYAVSWSPLLQGALQFSAVYTESGNSENDQTATLSENIRWRLTSYSLLTLSHSRGSNETDLEKNENESIFMSLRIYY